MHADVVVAKSEILSSHWGADLDGSPKLSEP